MGAAYFIDKEIIYNKKLCFMLFLYHKVGYALCSCRFIFSTIDDTKCLKTFLFSLLPKSSAKHTIHNNTPLPPSPALMAQQNSH